MNRKEKSKVNFLSMPLILCIFAIGLMITPQPCPAAITIDEYCQLTIDEMQQQISYYQELITLANQYKDDPSTLEQQEAIKRVQFDQEKEARYGSYGTTSQEYVLYMGENAAKVDAYLESTPDIKEQMENLKEQLNTLAEEHAALKEAVKPPSPAAPPLE